MTTNVYWKNSKTWVCSKHLPTAKIPAHVDKCWFCGTSKPKDNFATVEYTKDAFVNLEDLLLNLCSYEKCSNKKKDNRKYCSDKCRKNQARLNYTRKKKLNKN